MKNIIKSKIFCAIILGMIYCSSNNHLVKNKASLSQINKKRIGVINLPNGQNVGNILVKFSMYKKLIEFGFNVTIITQNIDILKIKHDLSFLKRTINSHLLIIKDSFSELKEDDFDFLILNSDQTWFYHYRKYFYDIAFLKFAKNWNIPKFIYGTSIGADKWIFSRRDEKAAKKFLKNFIGISFRENGLVKLAEENLGLKGSLVLDPTLLIDRELYLKEIKNFHSSINKNEKFIFIYQLHKDTKLEKFYLSSSEILHYKINKLQLNESNYIENFIFGISNCQAVITDSYHGTIFSIIFNKPFISFMNSKGGKGRFDSLKEIFNLGNRIIDFLSVNKLDINLLLEPPNINNTLLDKLRNFSNNYLKKNLGIL